LTQSDPKPKVFVK